MKLKDKAVPTALTSNIKDCSSNSLKIIQRCTLYHPFFPIDESILQEEEMYTTKRAVLHLCPRSSPGELLGTVHHGFPLRGLGEGTSLNSFERAIRAINTLSTKSHWFFSSASIPVSLVLSPLQQMQGSWTSFFLVLQPELHLMNLL